MNYKRFYHRELRNRRQKSRTVNYIIQDSGEKEDSYFPRGKSAISRPYQL